MLRRHATGFRALMMSADFVLAAAVLVGVSFWRFGASWADAWRELSTEPAMVVTLYAAGWVSILALRSLYRPRARWSIWTETRDIVHATVVMAIATFSVLFLVHLPDVSRLLLLLLFPVQAGVTIVSRVVLRLAMTRQRLGGRNTRYVLVLGAGPRGRAFAAQLEAHRELGLRIIGFLDDSAEFPLPAQSPRLGEIADLERVLHQRIVDEVVICLPFSQWNRIDAISSVCEQEGKIVRIPMDMLDRTIASGRVEELDGTPVFSLVSGPDRVVALVVKRAIDLAASIAALVVLGPLFAAIAIAIRVHDRGPVLFTQERIGLHGRPFRVVKFRSMVVGAEARRAELESRNELSGPAFKLDRDPRITAVGRFLRRTSLDELPQLWNVLRGEMSLVGPRPPLPAEVAGYDLWHRRRLSMKPGITGLWQVRGRREPNFDRWVASDLEYIDHWSLWLDFRIMVRTIPAALEGR